MSVDPSEWVDVLDWTPSPDAVAQLLRARTKDKDGVEVGAWTTDTRPTLADVEGIIEIALNDLTAVIGAVVPPRCSRGASGTAALLAAMLVELSYFPEQVRSDRSAYSEYKDLYDKQLTLLQTCVEQGAAGADAGGIGSAVHMVPTVPSVSAEYYGGAPGMYGGYPPVPLPQLREREREGRDDGTD